jgi:hypothetical protein
MSRIPSAFASIPCVAPHPGDGGSSSCARQQHEIDEAIALLKATRERMSRVEEMA